MKKKYIEPLSIALLLTLMSTTFAQYNPRGGRIQQHNIPNVQHNIPFIHTINVGGKGFVEVKKDNHGHVTKKWISSKEGTTIYKPFIKFQLNNSNYLGVKKTGYSWNNSPPNNTTISWENGLKFERNGGSNGYTTVWYDVGNLFKQSRNIQISYDEIFKNGASWGGINIANWINIDTNPSRVGFRGPEIYGSGVSKDEMHHVDIFINEVGKNSVNVKVYIDNKKIVEHIYTSSNIANLLNKIGLRSNKEKGIVIFSNLVIIPQDLQKIGSNESPLSTYYIDNGKEKYKYTYVGYYKPFGPNRGHWNVELVGCVGDYSLTPTTDGGKKCEMWCTVGSSKIGYCRVR